MPSADISGTLPVPKLKAGGKKELDELMTKIDKEGEIPCMWWMAANVNETIYESARGYNEWGDEKSGAVDMDSSESFSIDPRRVQAELVIASRGTVLSDQTHNLCKRRAQAGESDD